MIAHLLILSCARHSVPDPTVLATVPAQDVRLQSLGSGDATAVLPVEGHALFATVDESLTWIDGLGTQTQIRAVGPDLYSALRLPDQSLLLATDEGLLSWTDILSPSTLGLAGVRQLSWQGQSLYLGGPGGLRRWKFGAIEELQGEAPLTGPFATGGRLGGAPVLWAAGETELLALGEPDWTVWDQLQTESPPESMAVDSSGVVVVALDGLVLRGVEGSWKAWKLPARVEKVLAHPAAPGVYLAAVDALYWLDGESFSAITVPDGVFMPEGAESVDQRGGLLLSSHDGITRLEVRHSVGLVGLHEGEELAGSRTVTLLAAGLNPESIETVQTYSFGADAEISLVPNKGGRLDL
ncbi:MAG TPA: hypothetical protein PKY30_22720, partial [Myxococcota bacterium]|nr:hypothetical protein [Myxococcota bacterium]